jgi:flagellar biosynthesis protein
MLEDKEKVAVALLYDKIRAPKLIAKGRDDLARSIVDIASESGVPVTEDQLLAETLSRLEMNQEIPESLFRSVAIVLAWVYRLQGKTPWDDDVDNA